MVEYKYYFSKCGYVVPENSIGKSVIEEVKSDQIPNIKSSISEHVHEIDDNHNFYTNISGKYHVLVYEFEHDSQKIKVVKYKPIHALYYNFCIKSDAPELTFNKMPVVPKQDTKYRYMEFDIQDFFDYNFEFFAIGSDEYVVEIFNEKYANIMNMSIDISDLQLKSPIALFQSGKIVDPESSSNINDLKNLEKKNIVCFDKNKHVIMIWEPLESMHVVAIIEGSQVKLANNFHLVPSRSQPPKASEFETVKLYIDGHTVVSPNSLTIASDASYKKIIHNSKTFGSLEIFQGKFEFVNKIHRNIIRNLYDKYLYIDVRDIGIGKCRDVYSYSQYVNRNDIYGVEPNRDFSKFCTIRNVFNSTADDVFKFFKLKRLNKKFHTIVFCNSYNFVTNPFITMKECEEFLDVNGRIIMVYMNNDKVVNVKNKFYEIRKGESNPDLPKDSPLVGRQNFIQIFNEFTLVPPHYENQISESEILKALENLNKELITAKKSPLLLIEKSNMIHPQYSNWLIEEGKLFNSMFYYCVIGRECKFDKIIIAFDTYSTTLQSYINYLHKKRTFCNGVQIVKFEDFKPNTDKPNPVKCVVVSDLKQYEELAKHPHDLFINIQTKNELEYSSIYRLDIDQFIKQREKLLSQSPQHSKFGFPERQ